MAKGILEVQLIDAKGLKNTDLIGNSQSSATVGSLYLVGLIGMRWPQARSTRTWWFNTEAKSARAKLPEVSRRLLCGRSRAANWWHELLVSSSSSTNKIISWFHELKREWRFLLTNSYVRHQILVVQAREVIHLGTRRSSSWSTRRPQAIISSTRSPWGSWTMIRSQLMISSVRARK